MLMSDARAINAKTLNSGTNIPRKQQVDKQKIETVTEEFGGRSLTHFGGTGLIRRFFERHQLLQKDGLGDSSSRAKAV